MYDDALIRPWFESAVERVPGLSLFDAHAHIGSNDPDGLATVGARADRDDGSGRRSVGRHSPARARRLLRRERPRPRGVRTIGRAARRRSAGSTRTAKAIGEARRCVEAGARGIKLHPRAERFELSDPELEGVFALAHERRLPVSDPRRSRDSDDRARCAHARQAVPVGAVDPRPRSDLRSQLDLARGAASAQSVLRYGLVALDRPRRAVRADPAGSDPVRQRPSVLHSHADRHLHDPDGAPGRRWTPTGCGRSQAGSCSGCSTGRIHSISGRPSPAAEERRRSCSSA